MVFYCESALCRSHSAKKPSKYPFMCGVKWVKFPTNKAEQNCWKRLLRRKDPIKLTYASRLCSRHFDLDQLLENGHATGTPKYFEWNNWGQDDFEKMRQISLVKEKITYARAETQAITDEPNCQPLFTVSLLNSSPYLHGKSAIHQDVAMNTAVDLDGVTDADTSLFICEPEPESESLLTDDGKVKNSKVRRDKSVHVPSVTMIPPIIDHDYIVSSGPSEPSTRSVEIQTDLTMECISYYEELASRAMSPATAPQTHTHNKVHDMVTESDERVNYYTGFDTKDLLFGIWESIEAGAEKLKYWRGKTSLEPKKYENSSQKKPGPKRLLPPYFEFLMTLIYLRLGLPQIVLSDLFGVDRTCVTQTLVTWIKYLHDTLVPVLLVWPSQSQVRKRMPQCFQKHYGKTRVVIDCTEFFIQRPRNKEEQYRTYSQYKSHNTFKCLVGVNPNGAFTFISDFWSGNVSDRALTEQCGLLEMLDPDDQVMADRGFHIEDVLLKFHASLAAPPFTRPGFGKKGRRLNVNEIRKTRDIARLRIHVERAIERLKKFKLLRNVMPYCLWDVSDLIVKLCAALCNLKGPLFHTENENIQKSGNARKSVKRLKRCDKKLCF